MMAGSPVQEGTRCRISNKAHMNSEFGATHALPLNLGNRVS